MTFGRAQSYLLVAYWKSVERVALNAFFSRLSNINHEAKKGSQVVAVSSDEFQACGNHVAYAALSNVLFS